MWFKTILWFSIEINITFVFCIFLAEMWSLLLLCTFSFRLGILRLAELFSYNNCRRFQNSLISFKITCGQFHSSLDINTSVFINILNISHIFHH